MTHGMDGPRDDDWNATTLDPPTDSKPKMSSRIAAFPSMTHSLFGLPKATSMPIHRPLRPSDYTAADELKVGCLSSAVPTGPYPDAPAVLYSFDGLSSHIMFLVATRPAFQWSVASIRLITSRGR